MPKLQVLPSYRLIADLRAAETDLRLSAEARQRLIDEREKREQHLIGLAANAYRRVHGATEIQPLEVTFAPVRARRAVEIYLSDKAFETALPHLRRMLKAFLAAPAVDAHRTIERFTHLVGSSSDIVPPFAQMRALYCYGDPSFNGLETEDGETIRLQCEREKRWATTLSPSVLLEHKFGQPEIPIEAALGEWLSLARQLLTITGTGRSPIVAEINFVAALAHYWRYELQAVLANSRSKNHCADEPWQQRGLFADFVRASAEMIPLEYRTSSWERAIRGVLKPHP